MNAATSESTPQYRQLHLPMFLRHEIEEVEQAQRQSDLRREKALKKSGAPKTFKVRVASAVELFAEAAEEAKTLMDKYLMGKDAHGAVRRREKITQKTLGPLKRIGEKFRSFSFLDHTVEPLAQIVEHVLGILPQDGPIEGVHLMHVWTLAKALSNSATALEAAQLVMDSGAANLAFETLLGSAPEVVNSPAEEVRGPTAAPTYAEDILSGATPTADEQPVAEAETLTDSFQPEYVGLF